MMSELLREAEYLRKQSEPLMDEENRLGNIAHKLTRDIAASRRKVNTKQTEIRHLQANIKEMEGRKEENTAQRNILLKRT